MNSVPPNRKEQQNLEWKESWRDDYLRWICGFANAEGGVLVIGRNDRGQPVGVANAARLLEEIPNKVRDVLGIMVAVIGVWVTFPFAPTKVTTPQKPVETPVETRVKTPEKILAALKAGPDLTLAELAPAIGKSLSAVERATARLMKAHGLVDA